MIMEVQKVKNNCKNHFKNNIFFLHLHTWEKLLGFHHQEFILTNRAINRSLGIYHQEPRL